MITIHKIETTNPKEIIFSLEKVKDDNAFVIILEYLEKKLGCEIVLRSNFVVDFFLDFSKNDIVFRFTYEEGYEFFDFCSPNHTMESPEYYEKLEKIVSELVDALNRDNHILKISE